MIQYVKVDGTNVDLNTVDHDVSITVGRRDLTTTFAPSACRITFYDVIASTYTALVGKTLTVDGNAYQLFGGYITDVRLTVATETSGARCDIIAAGPSSRLGLINVNDIGYAQTTVALRCDQIADDVSSQTGEIYFVDETGPDEGNYTLANLPAATQSATTALEGTLGQVGGVVYDNPYDNTGGSRPTGRVAYFTNDNPSVGDIDVDASLVLFAPTFEQSGQIINTVLVEYDSGTITRSNATSQTLYGKRTRTITTTIVGSTDATDLADETITRSRRPRWAISDVTVKQSPISPEYLYTRIGGSLTIDNLPLGSPASTYTGIVQGWEHRITGGDHRTTFYLADPSEVGRSIAWDAVPALYLWNTNADIIWDNFLTAADLET